MAAVSRLGYLTIGVHDLDEALEYYTRFVRLDVTSRVGHTAFLTGGLEHHWVRLEEGPTEGMKQVSYVVDSEADLLEIRGRLVAAGIAVDEGGDVHRDRLQRWLRFVDPGGMNVEVFAGMVERGVAPMNPGITMTKFLHAAWASANFDETTTFYQDVLGFKASDWVETRAGFFRAADRYHHSLVLIRAERALFNHFCIQVDSLDDIMRARHNALSAGVKLRDDLLRHAPSGSIGIYMKDEARKFAVEFCIGHPIIDDATHRPRILPSVPETMNVWTAPLPDLGHQADAANGTWVPGGELTVAGIARPS
jgi:catechol 2,3-dioxygenase-like lactoylglutathione lyase family enzyme